MHTGDGGATWIGQGLKNPMVEFNNLLSVFFIDDQTGWVIGVNGTIMKTTDAGKTWELQNAGVSNELQGIFFVDANTGWITGDAGTIVHTKDGGATWNIQKSGVRDTLRSAYFNSPQEGWVVGSEGAILHTTDGGVTWLTEKRLVNNDLHKICQKGDNLWVVGDWGIMLKY
jgi:photosystem II stability/assembly factor-like uncharacterized protein